MLEKIKSSNDLKHLSLQEKEILASELRQYILEVVSKNGGHLASNLGIVELTIALESCLNLPKDKVIFDVGHQSYVHKILNGRYTDFKNIRKLNHISGFPKTSESETDTFNTGHSSTSISAALGIATVNKLEKNGSKVVAVIGDGALTGGMAYEGLMNAGTSKANILVILNDNEMSISKNLGGINKLLSKIRTKKHYVLTNNKIKHVTQKIPFVGDKIIKICHNIKWSVKQLIIPNMFFEDIGFKYFGVCDGHDIDELEQMIKLALSQEGPVLLHVHTKKGKGYEFAEKFPDKFHSTSPFDLSTGQPLSKKGKDFSAVFGDKLIELAQSNDKIIGITAAMKDGTGLKDFAVKFPDRFIDTTIAEQHALTLSAGIASAGYTPVINIYSSFYQRGYDQIIHDIAMQNLGVVMCVDRAGIVGNDGETHQGLVDMAMFRAIPNLNILAPSNFSELEKMLEFAVSLKKPVTIRFPRGGQNELAQKVLENEYKPYGEIKLGKAQVLENLEDFEIKNSELRNSFSKKIFSKFLKKGNKKVLILAIGKKVSDSIIAKKYLNLLGIDVTLVDVRFLKPFDTDTILPLLHNIYNIVTVEDGYIKNGLASEVCELISKNKLEKNLINIGYGDIFVEHGSVSELERKYMTDYISIISKVLNDCNLGLTDDEVLEFSNVENIQKFYMEFKEIYE